MFRMHIAELHIHSDGLADSQTADIKRSLHQLKEIAMATQAESAQQYRDLKAQNDKAHEEQLAAFAALQQAVVDAGNSTPEMDEAMAALKASIQRDDDQNPDPAPVPPVDPAPV